MTTPNSPAAPKIAVLTTEAELDALVSEWDALWSRVTDASPFVSPGWMRSWWRHLGGGALRVFTARADGRLVAVLPMFIWNDCGLRRLLPLGISVSDAFDLLAEAGWRRPVQGLLGPWLGQGGDWDRCELHELPQEAALSWLEDLGTLSLVRRQSVSPVLELREFAAQESRSAPIRKQRRARRRADSIGALRIDHLGPQTPADEIRDAMERLFELHAAQWEPKGEAGVLAGSALQAFHHDVAAAMAAHGALHLFRLSIDGAVRGVFYGFLRGRRAYAYASGVDPALAQVGPGTLLISAAIEAALAAGAQEFDFLRGGEAYKYDWGAIDRPTVQITLTPARDAGRTGLPPAMPIRSSSPTPTTRMLP